MTEHQPPQHELEAILDVADVYGLNWVDAENYLVEVGYFD